MVTRTRGVEFNRPWKNFTRGLNALESTWGMKNNELIEDVTTF
ncbi:hypothetical protein [Paenibacillus sp. 23TSA30-6]|nr:hypothetical protein [Paenibacillus sp. 23TSA30-6]